MIPNAETNLILARLRLDNGQTLNMLCDEVIPYAGGLLLIEYNWRDSPAAFPEHALRGTWNGETFHPEPRTGVLSLTLEQSDQRRRAERNAGAALASALASFNLRTASELSTL